MQVFVLSYTHKHGVDINVYATEALAIEGAAAIIAEYIEEIEDVVVRTTVKLHLQKEEWQGALNVWSAFQNNDAWQPEELEILEKEVIDKN